MLEVSARHSPIDAQAETARFLKSVKDSGAVASFLGCVRGVSDGVALDALHLEHYPGMCEKEMTRMGREAEARYDLESLLILHRYGRLRPREAILLVMAASERRRAAFDAVSHIVHRLKTDAPFWKREESALGSRWIAAESPFAKDSL